MDLVLFCVGAFCTGAVVGMYGMFKNTNYQKRCSRLERTEYKLRNRIRQQDTIIASMRARRLRKGQTGNGQSYDKTAVTELLATSNRDDRSVMSVTGDRFLKTKRVERYYYLLFDLYIRSSLIEKILYANVLVDLYRFDKLYSLSNEELDNICKRMYRYCYDLEGCTFELYGATFGVSPAEIRLYYDLFIEKRDSQRDTQRDYEKRCIDTRFESEFGMYLYNLFIEKNISRHYSNKSRSQLLDLFFTQTIDYENTIYALEKSLDTYNEMASIDKRRIKLSMTEIQILQERNQKLEELLRLECKDDGDYENLVIGDNTATTINTDINV